MKKVLVISTSLRAGSNSRALAEEFARGAREAGNEVEEASLEGRQIAFCTGCLACQKTGSCVLRDDAAVLAQKVGEAEVLVLATPVYYYGMSGQMKTFLDRCNPLFAKDYRFREVFLLTTAADPQESAMDGVAQGLQGWLDCFPKARLAGELRGTGLTGPGEARQNGSLLQRTRELGRSV
jgi:multimeric flavodoxin WrbA